MALRQGQGEPNARLEALGRTTVERFEALEHQQTETETRLATELVAVAQAVREVRDPPRDQVGTALQDHDRRISALESRGTS